jgi:hypothetical protein
LEPLSIRAQCRSAIITGTARTGRTLTPGTGLVRKFGGIRSPAPRQESAFQPWMKSWDLLEKPALTATHPLISAYIEPIQ